ncbi:unnamed protein product [Ambrosiozyma monospora]|uniref:Unnamed protein product n=1 Tax=Ambrosiozyma monospora TaxID=43982 RepID=A0A9W7DCG9_AMBMO|nr:unnamed protein product [Ambrosiozyma monospora]
MSENTHELHKAAQEGNAMIARGLLAEDPKLILQKDLDSRTPLHWACSFEHVEVVKLLLNPFDIVASGLSGNTGTDESNRQHKTKKFEFDIDDMTDDSGWTPLHITASTGNLEIFKLLMAHVPKPDVDSKTCTGQTCLHYAVSKNHYDLVDYLLKECKANARVKDKKSQYPLHRAAAIGSLRMCESLIDIGKSALNSKDSYGFTPMHHAMSEGHGDVAIMLVKRGADYKAVNKDDETPFDVGLDDKVKLFFKKGLQEEGLLNE